MWTITITVWFSGPRYTPVPIQMFDGPEGVFVSREIRLNFVRANRL